MNRRRFLAFSALGAGVPLAPGALLDASAPVAPANKRERMLAWLAGQTDPHYTPAAFFLHFGPEYKNGLAAANKHLDFFRQTGMDFVKIQYEQAYELQPFLQKPADWSKLQLRKIDFYEPLIVTVREVVKQAGKEALVLMTLYSPFMSAGQCAGNAVVRRHLEENPEAVKRGLDILTESQLIFVRACIAAGIDGFYMSTQGSETGQFSKPEIFQKYIKPHDLVSMKEISAKCRFNILHVCDYNAPYAGYDAVLDYPGHVVNCNTRLAGGRQISLQEIGRLFKRPVMGGLDRHGLLAKGPDAQLDAEVRGVLKQAPKQFILGADCTVPSDLDWKRIRRVTDLSHQLGS